MLFKAKSRVETIVEPKLSVGVKCVEVSSSNWVKRMELVIFYEMNRSNNPLKSRAALDSFLLFLGWGGGGVGDFCYSYSVLTKLKTNIVEKLKTNIATDSIS